MDFGIIVVTAQAKTLKGTGTAREFDFKLTSKMAPRLSFQFNVEFRSRLSFNLSIITSLGQQESWLRPTKRY